MTHGIILTGYCARWASGLVVEPLGTWDSTGQETLAIESASDEWQGTLTATFWGPGAAAGTDMLMTDGACIVPPEALAAPGNGTITLRCTNAQGRRISVDLAYHSAGHAQVPGSPSEPTPDLWQQYVEQVAADADRAEQASKDAAGSADAAAKSAEGAPMCVTQQGETQQQTTTGAQLFDIDSGEPEELHGGVLAFACPLEVGEKYTLSTNGKAGIKYKISDSRDGYTSVGGTVDSAATFTMAKDEHIADDAQQYLYFWLVDGNVQVTEKEQLSGLDVMLCAGSTALPWEPYTGGAPSPSPDYPQEIAGIDSPVTAQTSDGQTTTSISMAIGSPLYGDGNVADTVANDVPSGCDKAIVLDGSEAWTKAAKDDVDEYHAQLSVDAFPSTPYVEYSDRLHITFDVEADSCLLDTAGTAYIRTAAGEYATSTEFVAALTANPLKIWYRSTAYTEAADLHIDKVTRRWRMVELDGTEGWTKTGQTSVDEWMLDGVFAPYTIKPARSSHFAYTNIQQIGSFYINSAGSLYLRFTPGTMAAVSDLTAWLSAQKSAGTPVRVLYQLATPEEYASDPHTLPALGSLPETVKATGQSTVEYSADTKSYIDAKFAALSAAMLGG